ncbi:MAG: oxaloacetate decarboxylase subunit alpha [Planctomycetota bacterium]
MVKITETVLRDGHQSLIATRMTTADMLPILEKMDRVGYFSLEMWGGATFDVCLRFLNEDPWERLRQIRKAVKKTKLQMLLRGQNLVGYRHYADDVVERFVAKARENGIDVFRIFDAVNDIRNMTTAIKAAKKAGALVEGTISYTSSPVHTIEKYIKFALELKNLGADIICIKDMAGFISPAIAYDLTNALKKEVNLPVHLHSHCSGGMAPVVYLIGCEAGADILDTAISPFGWGASQPPTETIVAAFKGTPYDTGLDLELLMEIADYFQKIKEKYKDILDPISERVDTRILLHQIPGGMISNLISQLKEQNAMDKYEAVLKETPRVRKDLGYPPLVTPTSQIVGTQAVLNVLTGERYKIIPKEVKDYIRGMYGQPPGPIDETLKQKVLGDEEPIQGRPADLLKPEMEQAQSEAKEYSETEEDILSYVLFPQVAKEFFEKRRKGELTPPAPKLSGPVIKPSGTGKPAVVSSSQPAHRPVVQMVSSEEAGKFTATLDNKKYQVNITRQPQVSNAIPLVVELVPLFPGERVGLNGRSYEVKLECLPVPSSALGGLGGLSGNEIVNPVSSSPLSSISPSAAIISSIKTAAPVSKPVVSKTDSSAGATDIKLPMPGKIVNIKVKVGDRVKKGEMLLILEAMKMQNEIDSPCSGAVTEINIKTGDNVDNNTVVMRIKP